LGETVALMCNLSVYFEIHWLKISEGRLMALMVTSLKHTGELSVVWNYNETHFEGFMEMQTTGLRILHVSTSDLATYYCATSYQKRLDFDKGVQLYSKCDISFIYLFWLSACLDGPSLHYQVFAAVLSFGLLGMLFAVFVVHMKTRTKDVKNDEK
uniref:Ig-like domain-containing protein n=1 Tax=Cyprinus carpio TaxID=7962 RepID=A0A8C1TFG9_CYPCA